MKQEKIMETLTNKTFENIVAEAKRIQSDCRDYLVENAGCHTVLDPYGNLHFPDREEQRMLDMPLSGWAMGQLADKTGVAKKYLERCFASGHGDLGARNVNTWLSGISSTLKIRTYQGQVRGIVSGKYTDYDADQFLETLLGSVITDSKWDMRGSFINEERLHLRMTQKDALTEVGDLFPAIFIDSSDVGRSALRISFGIFRLACTNGLIIPAICRSIKQRHIGINKDDLMKIVAQSVEQIPFMMDNAKDLIRYAENKKVSLLTDSDLEAVRKQLHDLADVSDDDAKQIIRITQENYWENQWGLVNGITEFAQTKTLERRIELETAAGVLLAA